MARLGSGIPLIARRAEMQTLQEALHHARSGRSGAMLMSGDAGVGKSRLLTELLEQARSNGDVVFTGRCLDTAEATLPYLPFAEAVHQLAEHDSGLITGNPALRRLLPGQAARSEAGDEHAWGQLQLFDALHAALDEISAEQTTILAIEDLHWADRSSRDLLSFLLSRLSPQRRLLVVGTLRSDDLHRRHPMRPVLAELVRLPLVDRIHLEPFTTADSYDFVRSLSDATVPEAVLRAVAERSEGNAFLAEELISASSTGVPPELAEVLLSRIERLAPATQQVMRLASVAGRRFTHQRISDAATVTAAELDEALREAVTRNVLVIDDGVDTYAFRHALLREAIYTDLLPGERSRLHQQVAQALRDAGDSGAAAELAHHSMESHDLPGALTASVRAAREADKLGAPAELLVHTERALQLWCAVDDSERISGVDELELTRWAARAAGLSGEPDRAIAHSRAAIQLVDTQSDVLRSAEVRARYARYLITLDGHEGQVYEAAQQAWELVAELPPSAVKAQVHAMLALALRGEGRIEEAGEQASAAIETARAVPGEGPQTAAEAEALITRISCVERRSAPASVALERLSEAVELAAKVGAHEVELRARFIRGMTLLEDGRLAEAVSELDAGARRAAAEGLTWSGIGIELRVVQVVGRFMTGDWDGAETAAELVGEAVSGTVMTRVSAASLLVAVGRGKFDIAERRLAHLRERWSIDQQVVTLVGLAGTESQSWRGKPDQAAELALESLRLLHEATPWHMASLSLCGVGIAAFADQAENARAAGDTAAETAAIEAGEALAARAEDVVRHGRPQTHELGPEGRAWLARVKAETGRLRGDGNAQQWLEVVSAFGYGEIYRQAYAQWRSAEALLAAGDRVAAAEQLHAAARIAATLGAEPLREAVGKLANRARLHSKQAAESSLSNPLTPREQAVLSLVATGGTNRQIGAELFISEKTVSVHLSRVMAKLGVTSRTEAVSSAYARGLLGPSDNDKD